MAKGSSPKLKNYNGLTLKEQLFCDEFLKSQDLTKAALAAGYSKSTAKKMGSQLYKRQPVQDYLQTISKTIERETIAATAELREILTSIARGQENVTEPINTFIGGGVQEVQMVTRKPNNRERLDAVDKLLKVSGAYNKDVNLNVKPLVIKDDL